MGSTQNVPSAESSKQGMKLIIAGGRDYQCTDLDYELLNQLWDRFAVSEVVCGGARGADDFGKQWADYYQIKVKMFPADWSTHGRAAGPIRNRQMAEYADAVILFPGGRGTDSMYRLARESGLLIFDFRKQSKQYSGCSKHES